MKLFTVHATPPHIKSWHVPILKTKVNDIVDDTWDLSMQKIIKEIDGIKDVRRIAHDADVALNLTKIALRHLAYYKTIIVLDMFLFGNIYQPTAELKDFIDDKDDMQTECGNYCLINGPRIDNFYLCRLFTSLVTGRNLKEWIKMHLDQGFEILNFVDVRRFIHYGLVKGLVYRVHKYAISHQHLLQKATAIPSHSFPPSTIAGLSSPATPGAGSPSGATARTPSQGHGHGHAADTPLSPKDHPLYKYTDGCHPFDQITTEKNMGDPKVMDSLRKWSKGDLEIMYR